MPIKKSWTPPTKRIRQARLGQPLTGSPKMRVLQMMTIMAIKAMRQNTIPKKAARVRGTVEKATIPSIAYLKSCQNDQ